MATTLTKNRLREFLPANWIEVDSLLDQFLGPYAERSAHALHTAGSLWEEDGAYHIEMDVPGVAREDVEITYDQGVLSISAERKAPEEKRAGWTDERRYGKFVRTVKLPESIDVETIEAELTDGVLRVHVAKKPEAQPKRIDVK